MDIKTEKNEKVIKLIRLLYLILTQNKNIFFFNIGNRYLMDEKQYLENICTPIEDCLTNKVNEFEKTVMKNDKLNDSYD